MGEENSIEWASRLGTHPECITRDEIHLPGQIRRGVNQVVALRLWLNQCQRGHVARLAPGSIAACRVTSCLRQAPVLYGS